MEALKTEETQGAKESPGGHGSSHGSYGSLQRIHGESPGSYGSLHSSPVSHKGLTGARGAMGATTAMG